MSRKYKFNNKEGLYFVSFAVVYWMDVFTRSEYSNIFINALKFYQEKDRLSLFAFCLMSNHVHLIFSDNENKPANLLGSLKTYTSKRIVDAIESNLQESRKEWMLWMFE